MVTVFRSDIAATTTTTLSEELAMNYENLTKNIFKFSLIFLACYIWFVAGTFHGYQTRDSDLYSRGYKDGQDSIFQVSMIRIRAMEKEIDRLKGRN